MISSSFEAEEMMIDELNKNYQFFIRISAKV